METKRIFLNHFYHPRFASGYDQNQLIITDVSKENNQRITDKPFQKILNTNNRMTDSNAESNWMVPKARKVAKNGTFH